MNDNVWNLKQESAGSARERDRDNEILVKQIQTGQGKRKELLERLWLDNLPLVQKIIHEMTGLERWKYSDIQDFEDLEQQAFLGILESIGKYEPDKHRTWPEGKAGFVTSATEKELIVQYHPGIGNVTNHFRIPIDEAVDAQWEIRYSHDMSEVKTYGIEKQDTEEGATE